MKHWLGRILSAAPIRFIADMVHIYFSRHVSRSAAQLAYFLTMTFFPILICTAAFLSRANIPLSDLLADLEEFLPRGVHAIFREYLQYLDTNFSLPMLIAGIFLTVLFAAAAIRGLTSIMHEIYGAPRQRGPKQFLASFLFALMLLVTVYLAMLVILSGEWFFRVAMDLLNLSDAAVRFGLFQWLKYLLLLAVMFLFIFLLYRFVAPACPRHPPIIPGALLASLSIVIVSGIFSAIVSRSTRYSLVYGSLASTIIMLVWLYLCGTVLILGNALNYLLFCRRENTAP